MQLIRGPVDGKQVAFEIFPIFVQRNGKKKMIVDQLDINGACAHSVSFDGSNLRYLLAFQIRLIDRNFLPVVPVLPPIVNGVVYVGQNP